MDKAQKREFMLKNKILMEPAGLMVLPRNMSPSKELFEKIGFSFKEFENPYYYITVLPEGWLIGSNYSPNSNQAFTMFDTNLNARVSVSYSTPPQMKLITRYEYSVNEDDARAYESIALVTDQNLVIASFNLEDSSAFSVTSSGL